LAFVQSFHSKPSIANAAITYIHCSCCSARAICSFLLSWLFGYDFVWLRVCGVW
jgi:hypothetical protein